MLDSIPVTELHLSNKALRAIAALGVTNCHQLVYATSPSSLLALRGVGAGTVAEVRQAIAQRLGSEYAKQWNDE